MSDEYLEEIDRMLQEAGTALDECAQIISEKNFNSQKNIGRIAESLMLLFEIRMEIFETRPDLKPSYLD